MFGKRKLYLLACILVMAVLAVGCGGQQPSKSDVEQKDGAVVVKDGLGREVKIEHPVKKIATSYGIATHMVFALGAQDRLVGMDSPSGNNPFFQEILPNPANVKSAGSPHEINVEQIIALDADLVIVPGRNQEQVKALEERGLTVFGVVAEDLDGLRESMISLGKALDCEEAADKFVNYYDETMQMVEERTRDLPDNKRPVVYLTGPMGFLSSCSEDMYQNDLIELCGGKNAAADLPGNTEGHGWVELSPEQVLQWNPDFITVVQYSTTTPEEIKKDSRWQGLKAVKNDRVYWFPANLNAWDYPSPQAILGMKWLAVTLHPELFPDVDMVKEADKFFVEFYGKSFSEMGGDLNSGYNLPGK